MFKPELYQESNILPKRDARQFLEEYAKEIRWKSDRATVIDIGCGEGGVTTSILKPILPDNFKELVGCDISEEMIQYANAQHATDCIRFTVLDIASDLPEQFREKFDHAFSFYALNWIKNQECAFSNIYDLLVEGGDCLLMLFGNLPVYDTYRGLARIPRWSPWLGDVERFVSPYHDTQEPEKDVEKMMTKIGFTDVKVKYVEKEFVYYNEEIFKKIMFAISPFKIPLELEEEYWKDYIKVINDLRIVDYGTDGDQFTSKSLYKVITVYDAMTAITPFKIPLEMQEDFWKDYYKVVGNLNLVHYASNDEGDHYNVKLNYNLIVVYGRK